MAERLRQAREVLARCSPQLANHCTYHTMTDYMLRTDTEAQMDDALEAAGLLVEVDQGEGELVLMPVAGCYVDRIGAIPAQYDVDGNIVKPGHPKYHANLRVTIELTQAQIDELPTFTPTPGIPYRVFI
jgi:hypothetical protein